jgi:hypothetical protein
MTQMNKKKNHGFSFFTNGGYFERRMTKDPEYAATIQAPARRNQALMKISRMIPAGSTHNPDYIRKSII